MKKVLKENDIRTAIREVVSNFLKEHRGPEGGYADYEGEDISYQSVYEQALDYLEGGHDVSSARELISALGFRPETFNDVDYETAYGACEDAIAFHYGEDENTVFENKIRKMVNEAVRRIVKEGIRDEYFPDEDQAMDDYYFGVMMTLEPDGILSEDWSEETINRLQSVKEEYCKSANGFCSVMVTKVNLVPDEFGGYDISIAAAVSAPEIPTHVVEEDVIEQLWYWFEDITGERTTNFHIVDERIVFDNRRDEYK